MSVGVVIPAAGVGRRMGTAESKQFLQLGSVPVLIHTLRVVENHPEITQVVVVTRKEEIERTHDWILKEGLQKVTDVVVGGEERQQSVRHGLKYIKTPWVLVHDAVRPFVSQQAIIRLLTAMRAHRAAVLAIPVKDTVKIINDQGYIESTPNREKVWAVQTPQAFSRDLLLRAHEEAKGEGGATDDAMLIEMLGIPVKVVEGEYTNIKITTPEDWITAKMMMDRQGVKG